MTTILLDVQRFGKNKKMLEDALNDPLLRREVEFVEPSPFGNRRFTGDSLQVGDRFPVCMDHPVRRRFAQVHFTQNLKFKVT